MYKGVFARSLVLDKKYDIYRYTSVIFPPYFEKEPQIYSAYRKLNSMSKTNPNDYLVT